MVSIHNLSTSQPQNHNSKSANKAVMANSEHRAVNAMLAYFTVARNISSTQVDGIMENATLQDQINTANGLRHYEAVPTDPTKRAEAQARNQEVSSEKADANNQLSILKQKAKTQEVAVQQTMSSMQQAASETSSMLKSSGDRGRNILRMTQF